jgi:hypothetical protein
MLGHWKWNSVNLLHCDLTINAIINKTHTVHLNFEKTHTHTHTHTHIHCTSLRGDGARCKKSRYTHKHAGHWCPIEETIERERGLVSVFGVHTYTHTHCKPAFGNWQFQYNRLTHTHTHTHTVHLCAETVLLHTHTHTVHLYFEINLFVDTHCTSKLRDKSLLSL